MRRLPPGRAPDADPARLRRLAQVHNCDPLAEGQFWYSVVTTGVYCRPPCPSRRARPENIRLHDTLAQAKATGFRPCGRCRPEAPSQRDRDLEIVRAVCRLYRDEGRGLSPRRMAADAGLSVSQFHRVFRRVTGSTPSAYLRSPRCAAEGQAPIRNPT